MENWKIEYNNDTGPYDDYFDEWWTVTNRDKEFKCDSEEEANWLVEKLNSHSELLEALHGAKSLIERTLILLKADPSSFEEYLQIQLVIQKATKP